MQPIRWGILATGNIAHKLAWALMDSSDSEVVAVGSRTQESADAFGDIWGIPKRHGSYEALADDPDVEVVYIATPHSHHHSNMLTCLSAGKHVLCEKAFTLNARQAEDCISLARDKQLFLMEAMWTRFFPAMTQVRTWLDEGVIGRVRLVQADFCFIVPYNPQHRIYNPALGGGALLDIGIYPISLASMVLGLPKKIKSQAHICPTGVDELDTVMFGYDNGASALLACSVRIHKPKEAFIVGDQGYIKIHDIFHQPDRLTLHIDGEMPQDIHLPYSGNGYIYEVEEVNACLRTGRLESPVMPLDETLALMHLMDDLRSEWGVQYPGEDIAQSE
jgi:predicted dehydrogenase